MSCCRPVNIRVPARAGLHARSDAASSAFHRAGQHRQGLAADRGCIPYGDCIQWLQLDAGKVFRSVLSPPTWQTLSYKACSIGPAPKPYETRDAAFWLLLYVIKYKDAHLCSFERMNYYI